MIHPAIAPAVEAALEAELATCQIAAIRASDYGDRDLADAVDCLQWDQPELVQAALAIVARFQAESDAAWQSEQLEKKAAADAARASAAERFRSVTGVDIAIAISRDVIKEADREFKVPEFWGSAQSGMFSDKGEPLHGLAIYDEKVTLTCPSSGHTMTWRAGESGWTSDFNAGQDRNW